MIGIGLYRFRNLTAVPTENRVCGWIISVLWFCIKHPQLSCCQCWNRNPGVAIIKVAPPEAPFPRFVATGVVVAGVVDEIPAVETGAACVPKNVSLVGTVLQLGVGRRSVLSCATPGWAASSIHTTRTEKPNSNTPAFVFMNFFICSPLLSIRHCTPNSPAAAPSAHGARPRLQKSSRPPGPA